MLTDESFLPPLEDCIETWRAIRWPEGVECPHCHSKDVQVRTTRYRGYAARYCCLNCKRWFNDFTGTPLEHSKVDLARWVYLMRELNKGRPLLPIAREIGVSYKTALRMARIIRRCLYFRRLSEPLEGEVEADDIHIKIGRQGRRCKKRPPRRRGLKRRGRGTYKTDMPPVMVLVSRDSPRIAVVMLPDASKKSIFKAVFKRVKPGSRIDTDSWKGYRILGAIYDHRSVKHSESYVKDGVHCNRAEAEWSIFRPWWAGFRGVSRKFAHLYLAQYEFLRDRRYRTGMEKLYALIGFVFILVARCLMNSLLSISDAFTLL